MTCKPSGFMGRPSTSGDRRNRGRGMGIIGFIRFIGFFSLLFMGFVGVVGCQEWLDELGVGDKDDKETDSEKKAVAGKRKGNSGGAKKRRKKKRRSGSRRKGRRSKNRKSRWKKSPQALVKPNSWGKVVHVVDADTVYLEMEDKDKTFVKARMVGIDAPECKKSQTKIAGGRRSAECSSDDDFFGLESYRLMKKFVMNKRVQVRCEKGDNGFCKCGTYGRPLLSIELDGKDIGEVLLERGGGWAFTKYNAPNMARYCRAEDRGRETKRGMWKHGSREDVLSKMSKKTRRWYKNRDKKCRRAMQQAKK
jgi:endonuclease YncB( thermonuclease family)